MKESRFTISRSLIDFVDAGYASDMMGCFTGLGAFGELSCFSRYVLCVLTSSSLLSLRTGRGPAVSLVAAMLEAATATAMLSVDCRWRDNFLMVAAFLRGFLGTQCFPSTKRSGRELVMKCHAPGS